MKNKSNKVIYLVLSVIFVVILLTANRIYYDEIREEKFYSRTEKAYEDCLQKAKQDNVETQWCSEIKSASTQAFNLVKTNSSNLDTGNILLIGVILIFLIVLNEKVDKLKEKINA